MSTKELITIALIAILPVLFVWYLAKREVRRMRAAALIDAQEADGVRMRYVFGIDWAEEKPGKPGISLAFAIVRHNREGEGEISRRDTFTYTNVNDAVRDIVELYNRMQPDLIIMETNGLGKFMADRLAGHDVPVRGFQITHHSKRELKAELVEAVRSGRIKMPTDQYFRAAYDDDLDVPLALAVHGIVSIGKDTEFTGKIQPIKWRGPERFA